MNFDRCAISPSLHRPPDAVGLNATKLRYASILSYAIFFGGCALLRSAPKLRYASIVNLKCLAIIHFHLCFVNSFDLGFYFSHRLKNPQFLLCELRIYS